MLSALLLTIPAVHAADGDVDLSFDAGEILNQFNVGRKVVVDSSGKIFVSGEFVDIEGHRTRGVARFNSDGTIDTTFTADVFNERSVTFFAPVTMAVLSDGKLLIGGEFTSVDGEAQSFLARLNTDGSLDTSYTPDVSSFVESIHIGIDGKTLIGGRFSTVNGVSRLSLARLNADGTLDTNFVPAAIDATVFVVRQHTDGSIYIGGVFDQVGGVAHEGIARLNSDGSLNSDFSAQADFSVNAFDIRDDGHVIVGGDFGNITTTAENGTMTTTPRSRMAILSPDGELDPDFDPAPNSSVNAIEIRNDGLIAVGGRFSQIDGAASGRFAVLEADGDVVGSLSDDFVGFNVESVAWQSDNKPVFTIATSVSVDGELAQVVLRKLLTGVLDTSLVPQALGLNTDILAIAEDSRGRILIGGRFITVTGQSQPFLARLDRSGNLDPDFDPAFNGEVEELTILPNGKIYAGGNFTQVNGENHQRIVRLNPDGTTDSGFNGVANGFVSELIVLDDGRVLIAGGFNLYNGTAAGRVAKLLPNGDLDPAWTDPEVNSSIVSMAVTADGNIIIGGLFSFVGAESRTRLALLNTNGLLDPNFTPAADSTVEDIAVLPDGDILISGNFDDINGVAQESLAKLNADGSLDQTYAPTFNTRARRILLQPDGKLLVGTPTNGTVNGELSGGVARLLPDGSLDESFDAYPDNLIAPPFGRLFALAFQQDGKLLVGGTFSEFAGVDRSYIVRLETGLPSFSQTLCFPVKSADDAISVVCM
ncbi:MAG: hypothetical protein AAF402_05680 [Pseudomonadota bacterium]